MMGTYSYTVSRFVPDLIRNEPVNIGIIAVDPSTSKAAHKFVDNLRGLKARCPGANLRALEEIVGSIKVGDMPGGVGDLERLANAHTHSLQFTSPRAAKASTLEAALRTVYDTCVRNVAEDESAPSRVAARRLLLGRIDDEVRRSAIAEEAAIPRPEFAGSRGVFRPDRAFRKGSGAIALHALSFAAQPGRALKAAKVLAIDYEDAAAMAADLQCAAVVDPAPDSGSPMGREMYEQAAGHLRDKDCEVIPACRIPEYVKGIARRIAHRQGGGRSE